MFGPGGAVPGRAGVGDSGGFVAIETVSGLRISGIIKGGVGDTTGFIIPPGTAAVEDVIDNQKQR